MRLLSSLRLSHRLFSSSTSASGPRPLRIVFGSQTGTAQTFAEALGDAARNRKLPVSHRVIDLQDFAAKDELLPGSDKVPPDVVFVVACYGPGEPTDNAKPFFKWLSSAAELTETANPLSRLRYAIFGLGNHQTFPERYQAVGKTLEKRLTELGAWPMLPRGEGDDGLDIESDFYSWEKRFWEAYNKVLSSDTASTGAPGVVADSSETGCTSTPVVEEPATPTICAAPLLTELRAKCPVQVLSTPTPEVTMRFPLSDYSASEVRNPVTAILRESRNLMQAHVGVCTHVELDISHIPHVKYETGDHLGVIPENDLDEVESVLRSLGVSGSSGLRLVTPCGAPSPNRSKAAMSSGCSLRYALTSLLDIHGPAPRALIRVLSSAAADHGMQAQAAQLQQLASSENYAAAVLKQWISSTQLLERFADVARLTPWSLVVDALPVLQPRFYSISSSSRVTPRQIQLTVRMHEVAFAPPPAQTHTTATPPQRRIEHGLCSYYLSRVQPGAQVSIFMRPSTFRLPRDPKTPIIQVAAGAGVAPHCGFFQERIAMRRDDPNLQLGESWFFWGLRTPGHMTHQSLIAEAKKVGALDHVCTAFSDDPLNHPAEFVTDYIKQHTPALLRALRDQDGRIYVCGGLLQFAPVVRDAFAQVWASDGKMTFEQGKAKILAMLADGTYQEDCAG